jgi:hypothetical protein
MQDKLATAEERARGLEAHVSELQSLLEESEVSCVATPFIGFHHVPCACCLANCLLPRESLCTKALVLNHVAAYMRQVRPAYRRH